MDYKEVTISQSLSKTVSIYIDNENNLEEEYHENDHYDILQLLGFLEEYVNDDLEKHPNSNKLKHLLEECQDWFEDEKIVTL